MLDYDTIIIGAGMSGLAAGIRLAYYQQRVCILERHSTIGGLNSFYRLDGRNFDVGLHAVTNYPKADSKRGPLNRVLRQLRLSWEQFGLCPQVGSAISFPHLTLNFNNDFAYFEAEIARAFPDQIDNFRNMVGELLDYDDLDFGRVDRSAREFVSEHISDPLLREMIFCPVMYYGNASEHDMSFTQFCIIFRSIFLEGLGRPREGIRLILRSLVKKYKEFGGELKLHSGVKRLEVKDEEIVNVVLDDNTELRAKRILSSAGFLETMRMCEEEVPGETPGEISLVETISILNRAPTSIGLDATTIFFNDAESFQWSKPEGLVDCSSGVICTPNNFVYDEPLSEGLIRITCLANYGEWKKLEPPEYGIEKLRWYDRMTAAAVKFIPEFRNHVVATDMFTPTTIHRFTGHMNGALYGAPRKRLDGRTHIHNLFVCGTDQGLVGIVGALVGGLGIANSILRDE